jgi:hypothetical protein
MFLPRQVWQGKSLIQKEGSSRGGRVCRKQITIRQHHLLIRETSAFLGTPPGVASLIRKYRDYVLPLRLPPSYEHLPSHPYSVFSIERAKISGLGGEIL